jgi:hypothetical protein
LPDDVASPLKWLWDTEREEDEEDAPAPADTNANADDADWEFGVAADEVLPRPAATARVEFVAIDNIPESEIRSSEPGFGLGFALNASSRNCPGGRACRRNS